MYIVGSDYETVSSDITISLPRSNINRVLQRISIPIINDNVFEDEEFFEAILETSGMVPDRVELTQTRATIRVLDDDRKFHISILLLLLTI